MYESLRARHSETPDVGDDTQGLEAQGRASLGCDGQWHRRSCQLILPVDPHRSLKSP